MPADRHITRLRLTGFRNLSAVALDLDARHVVMTGPNGAGKTNILEAISLLTPGRGLRRATFEAMAQLGGDGSWAVATGLETPGGPVSIGTGIAANAATRRVRINGADAGAVEDMSDYLRVLWLIPAMDGLFTGPAADRRRFLDRLVTTLIPSHSGTVNDFETAMRQRNRLLETSGDAAWLTAIEKQMAELAAAVHLARVETVTHLGPLLAPSLAETGFPAAAVTLSPLLEGRSDLKNSSLQLEAELATIWVGARGLDRAAGRTLTGPHRVDVVVKHTQNNMPAELCSTGEQKALLIGLVLAHTKLVAKMAGITPFLLLDEIAAHLDPNRRAALFTALDALNTQCFMTGTDPMLFDSLVGKAQFVTVRAGEARLVSG